jgi:hypothetical protein
MMYVVILDSSVRGNNEVLFMSSIKSRAILAAVKFIVGNEFMTEEQKQSELEMFFDEEYASETISIAEYDGEIV